MTKLYAVLWSNPSSPLDEDRNARMDSALVDNDKLKGYDTSHGTAEMRPVFTNLKVAEAWARRAEDTYPGLRHYVVEITVVTGKRVP